MNWIKHIWGIGIILFLLLTQGFTQELLNSVSRSALQPQQEVYLRLAGEEENSRILGLSSVNLKTLKREQFSLSLPNGEQYQLMVDQKEVLSENQFLTKGSIGNSSGEFHMIQRGDMVTGHFNIGGKIYTLRPLGKGVHAILEKDFNEEEVCGNTEMQSDPRGVKGPTKKEVDDYISKTDRYYQPEDEHSRSTDDCKVRVLVVYTKAVGSRLADPLGMVHLAIELTNTGYANSGINHRIELAGAYETDYVEKEDQRTNLNRFTVRDRVMNEVHTLRARLRADMCHLLTTTGSGLAWVSDNKNRAFAVTKYTNISQYTFGHEMGHNHKARHDPSAYSGNSSARGYGHPAGYFRTVMAYPSACETGACGRVNEFSSPDNYYYDASQDRTFVTGTPTQDNVTRHNSSSSKIANHYKTDVNVNFGDMVVHRNEAIHLRAKETLQNADARDPFNYQSGAEGSFKAGQVVVLKPGFTASRGSDFVALIEGCSNNRRLGKAELSNNDDDQLDQFSTDYLGNPIEMNIYPNPFSATTTIEFQLEKTDEVDLFIRNTMGQIVAQLINKEQKYGGIHKLQFHAKGLPAGLYFSVLTVGEQQYVKKMMLAR